MLHFFSLKVPSSPTFKHGSNTLTIMKNCKKKIGYCDIINSYFFHKVSSAFENIAKLGHEKIADLLE